MKTTTQVTHAHIGRAVLELRRRLDWSQEKLGQQLGKYGEPTHTNVVGRWERGKDAPSSTKRSALAKLAARHKHKDLAAAFRAPIAARQLIAMLSKDEDHTGQQKEKL